MLFEVRAVISARLCVNDRDAEEESTEGSLLWADNGDDEYEGGHDADEDTLHLRIVGHRVWVARYVGLEVVSSSCRPTVNMQFITESE